MKLLNVVLCVLVTLSFVFSLAALLIVAQNNGVFDTISPTNSTTLEPTIPTYTTPPAVSTPQPTVNPPKTDLSIKYTETIREENNGKTKVTLTVYVTYKSGDSVTIKYSDFYLQLYTGRNIFDWGVGKATPKNSGSFTMGASHKTQTFQLSFEYETTCFNGMDYGCPTQYQLAYNGSATVQWDSRVHIV